MGIVYPKDKQKFGDVINYGEDPLAHRRLEFGFDVLQVARGNYSSKAYHDFIGFEVAQSLLERAFQRTYGLELKDIYPDLPLSINSFRWSVKSFLPELTRAAWITKKNDIEKTQPGTTRRKFYYCISRHNYRNEWGKNYHKPGMEAYMLAVVIKLFPKVGLARIVKFKPPTKEAEDLFVKSFNRIVTDYALMLDKCEDGKLQLEDINFDTGIKTAPCQYTLTDETYKELLLKLSAEKKADLSNATRENLLDYFKTTPPELKNNKEEKEYNDAITWLRK